MYCTAAQLTDSAVRVEQLAKLFDVATALLVATIAGTARDAWTTDEIAVADDALAAINAELTRASAEADARLARRGYALPMSATQFPVLTVWCRSIARYHLHALRDGEGADEDVGRIERDYRDARAALDLVAEGKLSLGAGDPLAVPAEGSAASSIRVTSKPRMFSRDSLGRL